MISDTITMAAAGEVVDLAELVVISLQQVRDKLSNDEWEALISNELVDGLVTACTELEASIEAADPTE